MEERSRCRGVIRSGHELGAHDSLLRTTRRAGEWHSISSPHWPRRARVEAS